MRTLSISYREIDEQSFMEWKTAKNKANMLFGKEKEEERDRLAEVLEQKLTLLGATAIEDKLQDGVPDTVDSLLKANIKIWMLTGDKQETAINIGKSCKLIPEGSEIIILEDHGEIGDEIEKIHKRVTESVRKKKN